MRDDVAATAPVVATSSASCMADSRLPIPLLASLGMRFEPGPRYGRAVRRRIMRGIGVWIATLLVLGVAINPPERCAPPSVLELDATAAAATGWILANHYDSGQWRYEYSRADGADLPGYNVVRHAGVMLALYLRNASVGDAVAFADAERGLEWIDGSPRGSGRWHHCPRRALRFVRCRWAPACRSCLPTRRLRSHRPRCADDRAGDLSGGPSQ